MVAAASMLPPPPDERPREDHYVVLRGATWADFQRLQEVRGDRSAPRITYHDGVLQIMSPSRTHESIESILGRLLEAYCLDEGVRFGTYGSWTIEDETLDRGVEPDECYVFGDVPEPTRPDLAIEVVWTSGGIDKLEAYRGLGVREVWFWRRGALTANLLRDGEYVEGERSELLPGLDLDELASFLGGPITSDAIRAYRAALAVRRAKR
jgi:Uma2 family endonuclease